VQIPTTLLAQVDSSVGGKTAVNHALGKNLIGAFYQPRLVLIDVSMLRTLPARELKAGLAEVVKYGVIRNRGFFSWLENNVTNLLGLDEESLIHAVMTSCQIKANIVENDEKEASLRAILNYGHTFGHAVEQLSGYGSIKHGEAVSIGMLVAAKLSRHEDLCQAADVERIAGLLNSIGLPTDIPRFAPDEYLEAMARDKKVHHGTLRFVLNRGIGDCLIKDIESPGTIFSALLQSPDTKGRAMAEKSSSPLGKIAAYTEILAKDPHSTVFVSLSEAYRQLGMLDDALDVALKGTANLPGFCPGYSALGRVLTQQGELSKATEAFATALELDPEHAQALKGLAKVRLRQGSPEQARELLLRALSINPDDSTVRKQLASLGGDHSSGVNKTGDAGTDAEDLHQGADDVVDSGTDEEPPESSPIPTETIADLYRKQGLLKEAAAIYRDILRLDPQRETVRNKLIEIKTLLDPDRSVPTIRLQGTSITDKAVALAVSPAVERQPEGSASESKVVSADPVSTLEKWLVSIEKGRIHVQ